MRLTSVLLSLLVVGSLVALPAPYPLAENSFDNPEFVKRFVGTYAFDQEINPQILREESELLNTIAPLMENNYEQAVAQIQSYIVALPADEKDYSPVLDYIIGSLYLQNGVTEKAVANYITAIKRFPNFYRAYQNLGLAYIQQSQFGEALPHLTKALEIGGGNGGLYGLIGYSYLNEGLPEAALDAYRNALLFEPKSRDWRLGKLNALVATGDNPAAARYIDELILLMPEDTNLWMQQVNSFVQLGRFDDAIANLIILRKEGRSSAPALVLLGDLFLNEGLADAAVEVYLESVETKELSPERQLRLVRGLIGRGSYEQAETLIQKIDTVMSDTLTPDEKLDVLTLTAKIALASGESEKAFAALKEVVDRDPLNGEAQLSLGDYYRDSGDFVRAKFSYEAAEKVEAFQLEALTSLARLEVSQRNYEEAVRLLKRAQLINERPYITDYIRRLEAALASAG